MARRKNKRNRQQQEDELKPNFEYNFFDENPKINIQKKAGKDRFFQQNYTHYLHSEDGYATEYQLIISERDYNKVMKALYDYDNKGNIIGLNNEIRKEFEEHVLDFLEDCFYVSDKWDRFDKDLKALSRRFKGCLFQVKCIGQDMLDDVWQAFAKDGKYYEEDIAVNFPEFNHDMLY